MRLTASETHDLVELLVPNASGEEKVLLEEVVTAILEGKDVGKFKGEISPFKQKALDAVHSMPRAASLRRKEEKSANAELKKLVDEVEERMMHLVRRLHSDEPSGRQISVTKFKSEMKWILQDAYRRAYDLGTRATGLGMEYQGLVTHQGVDEKRFVAKVYSQEQKYFNRFLDDIIRGESMSKTEVRVRNYANAIRSVFEASRTVQLPNNVILHWVLQSGNPCPECRLMHRNSPYTKDTLPTTPKSGSTRCLSYCYCKIRVAKADAAEVMRVARKNRSADYVLKQLRQSRKSR